MSAVELGLDIGSQIGAERRSPDRPFLNLSPIDSVVQKLTVPGAFSLAEQILVLKAHGLREAEIGSRMGISKDAVGHRAKAARHSGSYIEAIISLVDAGRITAALLTEGLDFEKYALLTPRQKDILNIMARQDMWSAKDSQIAKELGIATHTVQNHAHDAFTIIGAGDRIQAVIYRLFLPKEIKNAVTPDQQISLARRAWDSEILSPPDKLLEVLERSREQGFSFEPVYFPRKIFTATSKFPGQGIKPQTSELYERRNLSEPLAKWLRRDITTNVQYWRLIQEGKIARSSATFTGKWALVESIRRPIYDHGKQMYEDDALALFIEECRERGNISTPDWQKHVPGGSRFGLSANEIETFVIPHVVDQLGVDQGQVRLPRAIEFNIAGNISHPEWGETDTWEWLADTCDDKYNLIGGYRERESLGVTLGVVSKYKGLSNLDVNESYGRDDDIGFRLMINFPQQKAA